MTMEPNISPAGKLGELASAYPGSFVLIQGYPATGFARLTPSGLALSPNFDGVTESGPFDLSWSLFADFRVFGHGVEYHAWRLGTGVWHGRLRKAADHVHLIQRHYPIWGSRSAGDERNGWVARTEDRGTTVWIPREFERPGTRPVLAISQILEQHEETHLFGVVDAVVNGFENVEVGDE